MNWEMSLGDIIIIIHAPVQKLIIFTLCKVIQADSRSPFVINFPISQNRMNVKIGSRL
jgi:hypothetical protein